jgi:hypothetical protein
LPAVAAPVLAAVLTLLVSGCSTRESGAAAVVGDRRISVAAVQEAYQDIVPLVGQDQQISQGQILNLLILQPYLTQAAAAQGRGVSAEDARLDMKAAGLDDATEVSRPGLEVWRANLANAALQTDRPAAQIQATYEGIGRELKSVGVHVNPRYGSGLDYTDFSILPERPNWLASSSTPTPTPAVPAPDEQAPQEPAPQEQPTPGATPSP